MDPGFLKLLDDDEDENAPAAADVDAFAAVLKGDLGGAAHAAAAAAFGVTRSGNGTAQLLPQSSAASVSIGHGGVKAVPGVPPTPPSGQQQLLWNQLTPEQQRELFQRRALQQQQQRLQHQQLQQQSHAHNQLLPQQSESGSNAAGSRKSMLREGISFTALMPLLQPHLPPDQGQQLSGLYQRFKGNEITREDFIRGARVIAGDTVLVQTIRQMHMKQQQQAQLQQQLQQQKLQHLQQQQQSQSHPQPQSQAQQQPQSSQAQATQSQIASASAGTPTPPEVAKQQQQQQQQPQEQKMVLQQNLQPQTTQPPSQPQEMNVMNPVQQKLPAQAHPFQQTQVPSNADCKTLPQGSHSQAQLSSSLPPTQLQSPSVEQGDQQQDPGQMKLSNNQTAAPMLLQQVKHEVDKSLASSQSAKQQASSPMLPSMQSRPASAAHMPQTTVVTGASQPSQPYTQTGLPRQPLPGQAPGHVLQQPQPQPHTVPQALGSVTSTQPQPSLPPPAQAQPEPAKPLTKYAKQKLRKEQKKREEAEKARKLAEEERLKKVMEEENLNKLQSTPSSMVTPAHQGLHPQLSTPPLSSPLVDLNKQSYSHHPGSLSHQVQMHAPVSQVDKQGTVPKSPGGLAATGQGQSLIPVKQEPSDLQSEQKRQSFQLSKVSDFLPGQAVQKPAGQAVVSEASVLPPTSNSHVLVQGSNADQLQMLSPQGSMPLPSSSIAPNSAQQVGMASVPALSVVPQSPLGGSSGLQLTGPMKQVVGHQKPGPITPAGPATSAYSATSPFNSAVPSAAGGQPGHSAQPAATVSVPPAVKTPSKKPGAGQKKPAEGTPAQAQPSKKQKVSAGEPDQSIDQLNDVTAVSGVNLKEEEEQLLVGPKEESRTTEAMRKIVQEEEEKLFLERGSLRAKVSAIASRCGVKSVSEDVGRCLSMSVEERLRSMLYRLIKLSKQRCDVDKERHKVVNTSDVRRQILLIRRNAKEMSDKKLAEESDRLRKLNEKKDKGSLPEVEREELKAKAQKAQQEEEDRLKANAANVAARAAVGADDMLLKWQMMAEKGRQKRQGGDSGAGQEGAGHRAGSSAEGVSATNSDKKLENGDSAAGGPGNTDTDSHGPLSTSATGRPTGPGPGGASRIQRRLMMSKSSRRERTITLKDVIAFLETEPQMSKSTLLYRLYERQRKTSDSEKGHPGNRK